MRVLVACEFSGIVRDAFRERGHDAWSCDLLDSEADSRWHLRGDALAFIDTRWDVLIAHPPCTHLTVAGARWFKGREAEQAEAIAFAEALWAAPIERIALENPIGVLSTRSSLGKPTQIIQPWQFGHGETKATCLWLKGLPNWRPRTSWKAARPVCIGSRQGRSGGRTAVGRCQESLRLSQSSGAADPGSREE